MILEKKTALLSPRGAHGLSGVARFECFKEKSDVRISLNGAVKDLYAVVAVGEELRAVRPCADRVYLARTDLSGDCAVIVADGEKRVLCAGATRCGYDFGKLEEFLVSAYGNVGEEEPCKDDKDKKEDETEEKELVEEGGAAGETKVEKDSEKAEIAAARDGAKEDADGEKDAPAREETAEKENAVGPGKDENVAVDADKGVRVAEAGEKKTGREKKKGRFFDRIADKIGRLFEDNEREEELCALVPDSRWVRVKAEDGAYVVGIVGDPAEFICYGIPADNALDPPDEKQGCRQWLEVEKGGRGYWMMYQSAETGETLTADVI